VGVVEVEKQEYGLPRGLPGHSSSNLAKDLLRARRMGDVLFLGGDVEVEELVESS
jgi:hypothetical protein